ncbi:MAG: hypothetical protein DRN03_06625 [Thermoplasmata archaeon]|nr:MAG: hypothetical protein DRN03_06625 [Thermoplasmata archaeon]
MIGWRKLAAWTLVYVLVVLATWKGMDIPPNAKDLLMWVTGGFFIANAAKPAAHGLKAKFENKNG